MPILLVLAVVLGLGGGTAVVADNAKPGDVLFGVDRAVENVRIRFAGDEGKKNELRIRFAEERVEEIGELAEKSSEDDEDSDDTENLSDEDKEKVSVGVEETLNLISSLEGSGDARVTAIVSILNSYMQNLPAGSEISFDEGKLKIEYEGEDGEKGKLEVKQKKDGELRIKSESEDGRVRVEIKDGRIEIKSKVEDDDKDTNRGLEEVEAEILDGKATVEVELNDEKTIFTIEATDEASIIAAVLTRFPSLTRAQVEAVLEIEEEDADDEDEDDEDDDKEDEDDDDNDEEDEDEDNSGSGRD